MRITFIGAGKVAFSLGKYFKERGLNVTGYYSRQIESAKQAADFTSSKAYKDLETLVDESDAIFITVPDSAIKNVYDELKTFNLRGKDIIHCSGAMGAFEAFEDARVRGVRPLSLHPLFPFSDKLTTYKEIAGIYFCLEGDNDAANEWKERLEGLNLNCQIIASDSKASYHAACVIASNLVIALVAESLKLFEKCGFSDSGARKASKPLILANIKHILEDGPVKALTGPIERNDIETILKHLECLEEGISKEIYKMLSLQLIELAKEKHPDRTYEELKDILEDK